MVDLVKARALLTQALAALDDSTSPPPSSTIVHAGASIQAAIDAALPNSILSIEPGTYLGSLNLSKPLTLQSTLNLIAGRVTTPSPVILVGNNVSTLTNTSTGSILRGLTLKNPNPDYELLVDQGTNLTLDRLSLLGDPVKGQHRGFQANGVNAVLTGSVIDDCFLSGRDAQAIMGWNGTNGLLVDNCWLAGGAETVMFGGAKADNAAKNPQNILIKNSTLTKKRVWYSNHVQIKTAFEVKNGLKVTVQDCILEYAGIAEGQGAYLIVLTPRNQDNDTPWATVQDVLIERVLARYGGGCVNILGTDSNYPSGPLDRVTIRNVKFTDIDPTQIWQGSSRCFQFGDAPRNVTLDSLTVQGAHLASTGYFYGNPPIGLKVSNVVTPATTYNWKIDGQGQGVAAVKVYAPDAIFNLSATDTGASGYPS